MEESDFISLGVLCPSRDLANDQFQLDWKADRVANVKALVRDSMEEPRPDEPDMTFYFSGRKLREEEKLKDILTQSMVDRGKITFHLVITSASSPAEPAIPTHSYFTTAYNRSSLGRSVEQSASSSSTAHSAGPSHSVDSGSDDSSRYFTSHDQDPIDRETITLSYGSQILIFPSHACLIYKVSADEYTVAFAPPQLEEIKSHFSIGDDLSPVSINFNSSRRGSPVMEIPVNVAGINDNQNIQNPGQQLPDGFNVMANNDFVQLNVNDARMWAALTSVMGVVIKLFFLFCFIAAESTQPMIRMAQCLVVYAVFTLGKRWLENNGERIRVVLENALPHGLPAQVNLENYEYLWRGNPQIANEAQEPNARNPDDEDHPLAAAQGEGEHNNENIDNDGHADGVTEDEEPGLRNLHAVYADHARQQSLASKIYDSCRLLIGSLIPAIHERWLQEEQRRRQEVDRQMEERRRLLERLQNEKRTLTNMTDSALNEKVDISTNDGDRTQGSEEQQLLEPITTEEAIDVHGEEEEEEEIRGAVLEQKTNLRDLRSAWLSKLESSSRAQNVDEGLSESGSLSGEVSTSTSDE